MEISLTSLRKYFAEFAGTFGLTIIVITSLLGRFDVSTAVLASLFLGISVYVLGPVSGCHLNPAVTAGIFSLRKITLTDALGYIIAQFLGAGCASIVIKTLYSLPNITVKATGEELFAEFLGLLMFAFVISAVVHKRVDSMLGGFAIGGALLIGLSIAASLGAGAFLNPAVMFGLAVFSPSYLLIQVLGGIAGFQLFTAFVEKGKNK